MINISHSPSRNALLDILKGIGILLVVYAHVVQKNVSGAMIYLFHMPLFFLLSGAALRYSHGFSWKKKVKGLVQPYLLFSLCSFAYWALLENRFRPAHLEPLFPGALGDIGLKTQQFLNIFLAVESGNAFIYNVVLWFLPCLFTAGLLYEAGRRSGQRLLVTLLCVAAWCGWDYFNLPPMPWCLELAALSVPFLYMGEKGFAYVQEKLKDTRKLIFVIGGVTSAFLLLEIAFHPRTGMMGHNIPALWLFYLMAILGSVFTAGVGQILLPYEHSVLQYLGRNSLIIMCIHEPIKRIVIQALALLAGMETEQLRQCVGWSLLVVALVVCVCLPLISLINRYLPFLIGKSWKART